MNLNIPRFLLNEKSRLILIDSGKYKGTQYSYSDVYVEDETLNYVVVYNEFWVDGGKVTNAHESELKEFSKLVAQHILENMIEVIKLNSKLENN